MRTALIRSIVVPVLLILACPAYAGEGRTLGDYRFVLSPAVRDPFSTTSFSNSTGLSIASGVDVPILVLPTNPPDTLLSLKGDFLFVVAHMEYQYAVNRRIALRANADGATRVGTSGESLVSQGVSATWGGGTGATAALWEGDNVLLSAVADLRSGKVLVVDLVRFVEDIIAGNGRAPSLLTTDFRTSLLVGGSLAWAINEWSGLIAAVRAGHSWGSETKDQTDFSLGVEGSMDFAQRDQLPIGLFASATVDRVADISSDAERYLWSGGLGVLYTGREEFAVGGEVTWSRLPLNVRGLVTDPVSITVTLRYFF